MIFYHFVLKIICGLDVLNTLSYYYIFSQKKEIYKRYCHQRMAIYKKHTVSSLQSMTAFRWLQKPEYNLIVNVNKHKISPKLNH